MDSVNINLSGKIYQINIDKYIINIELYKLRYCPWRGKL